MTTATFAFKVITPEKVVYEADVAMAVIPGSEGDFGVLPYHAPFATSLKPGTITIHKANKETESLTITGGFAEVSTLGCQVLADSVSTV